tara:strand:- start:71 stop:694 length:624 start_codon:yes stop_codon:yes gene_type:complete
MATVSVNDIVKGLAQAAANAYDGSQYEKYAADGKARKVGLKREEGDAILDSRVMDGFKVRFVGPKLIITYQTELSIKEYHNSKLDEEIERTYKDIVKFLKKEYKAITGNAVTLKSDGDADIFVQNMSKIRTWAQARKVYTIGGMGDLQFESSKGQAESNMSKAPLEGRLRAAVEKFLSIGKDKYSGAKKPSNVKAQKGAKKTNNAKA